MNGHINTFFWRKTTATLTDQIVGGDDDATDEEQRARYSIMRSKDHVVDDRLVDEVSNFDEARDSGHHAENGHLECS